MNANVIASVLMLFVLIIFTLFLFQKGTKRYSNNMLIVYFFSQIIVVGGNTIYQFFPGFFGIQMSVYPVMFTWGPLFFLYIRSLLNPSFRLGNNHFPHFIPAFFVLSSMLLDYYGSKNIRNEMFQFFNNVFNLQIIGYNIAAIILYRNQSKKIKEEYSGINGNFLHWIKLSIFGFLISCSVTQVSVFFTKNNLYHHVNWFFVCNFTFFLFFTLLFYMAILYTDSIMGVQERSKNAPVSVSLAKKMIAVLDAFMTGSKPYFRPNLTLKELASESGIPERVLSFIINEYKKQNFFDFINSYRVETAMEFLSDQRNYNRTMLDILFESGFNSKTTFNTAFKKYTGMTPSDFRKNQNIPFLIDQFA